MNEERVSGESLRLPRVTHGISANEIARRLGVTRQAVSKWERDGVPLGRAVEYHEALRAIRAEREINTAAGHEHWDGDA